MYLKAPLPLCQFYHPENKSRILVIICKNNATKDKLTKLSPFLQLLAFSNHFTASRYSFMAILHFAIIILFSFHSKFASCSASKKCFKASSYVAFGGSANSVDATFLSYLKNFRIVDVKLDYLVFKM